VAMRILFYVRYTSRMLGIRFEEISSVWSDNQSINVNTQLPTSNKEEAVAAGILRTIYGICNITKRYTKPLGNHEYYKKYRHGLSLGRSESEKTTDTTHQGE
jgi:hypothetical protein